jgi:hypothetical protein
MQAAAGRSQSLFAWKTMKPWRSSLNAISLAVCLAVVVFLTEFEGHNAELGILIWPGASLSFLVFLVLHVKYFDHPTLATCMDVIFNTLIYWGIFLAVRAAYLWFEKRGRYPRP